MPTYQDPLNGLSESEALAEHIATAPIGQPMLMTYEIWHASMVDPVRVVVDHQNLSATLEATAPRNPGEEVVFLASNVQVERPDESDSAQSPEINLRVDNVSGFVADALRVAREASSPAIRDSSWELIERVYLPSDTAAPHRVPVFKVTPIRVSIAGPTAIFTAAYRDSANTGIPSISFTPEAYPGLLQ